MMSVDQHDDGGRDESRNEGRADETVQQYAALRSLEESGVEVTGSESSTELVSMQTAVDAFRRAAEALAGRGGSAQIGTSDDLCKQVVPPRAADETPRQYTERVNRMTERFRSLTKGRERPR
ncbi:MAG: hypothetical protein ABI446_15520 [Gemmatimonadaceae bacterium]